MMVREKGVMGSGVGRWGMGEHSILPTQFLVYFVPGFAIFLSKLQQILQ